MKKNVCLIKSAYFAKATVLLVVYLLVSFATYLSAEENEDIRNIAERFVRQVVERDTDAILHSYSMTSEFRVGMPNAGTVIGWARDINRLFGRLGDVVNSEIVEHPDLGLRSVDLYYQGTKRPARIRVTFSETAIGGFHYYVWTEGYAERAILWRRLGMTGTETVVWGFVLIPMVIMSLFLLSGRGAFFLIAADYTMSKEERAKYDESAMSRFIGMSLLWITCCAMLLPLSIHSGVAWMPYCVAGIITASILVFVSYASTGSWFYKNGVERENLEKSDLWLLATEMADEKEKREESNLGLFDIEKIRLCLVAIAVASVILALPVLLSFGEKDPTVKLLDSGIEISTLYGLKIDFSEITDISLMESRVGVIELTRRTNGYGTPSTLKGEFLSNRHGRVLLFTRASSAPTIHIKRESKPDVFLNLSNSEATRTLYNDMKTAFAR